MTSLYHHIHTTFTSIHIHIQNIGRTSMTSLCHIHMFTSIHIHIKKYSMTSFFIIYIHTFTSIHKKYKKYSVTSLLTIFIHTHTYNIIITVFVILIVCTVFTVALSLSEWFWCHILWWSISVHQTSLGFFILIT